MVSLSKVENSNATKKCVKKADSDNIRVSGDLFGLKSAICVKNISVVDIWPGTNGVCIWIMIKKSCLDFFHKVRP